MISKESPYDYHLLPESGHWGNDPAFGKAEKVCIAKDYAPPDWRPGDVVTVITYRWTYGECWSLDPDNGAGYGEIEDKHDGRS